MQVSWNWSPPTKKHLARWHKRIGIRSSTLNCDMVYRRLSCRRRPIQGGHTLPRLVYWLFWLTVHGL